MEIARLWSMVECLVEPMTAAHAGAGGQAKAVRLRRD
jgi:hypothetical protein